MNNKPFYATLSSMSESELCQIRNRFTVARQISFIKLFKQERRSHGSRRMRIWYKNSILHNTYRNHGAVNVDDRHVFPGGNDIHIDKDARYVIFNEYEYGDFIGI